MSLANQWRVKAREAALAEATDLELPSGMVIRAKRPSPMLLAQYNHLPLSLAAVANPGAASQGGVGVGVEMVTFMRDLLLHCVVDPAISLTPKEGEIGPVDIPDADVTYILRWAMRGEEAASLETFRSQRPDGRGLQGGGGIRAAAEHPDGHPGSGPGAQLRPGLTSNPDEAQE